MKVLFRYYGLFFVILLSFFAVSPLFISGFFPMHDDTQVARVFEMGKMLKAGIFPVRWVPDLGYGYGYPIFNFYAPLAYYAGGFFNLIGFDALIATKIMVVLGIILSGIFMYLLAREFWGELGAIVSGLFYMYAPYHAVDIYIRGDVAEFWAYAFIPLAFYGLWKIYREQKWKYVIIGSIGYAGVILSHNLTAMMVTLFIVAILVISFFSGLKKKNLSSFIFYFSFFFLGLLLSAFYWIPALLEMQYTNVFSQIGGGADFKDHFVCLYQLWESPWGFGGSVPGCIDGLSLKIGKLHIVIMFSAILILSFFLKRRNHYNDTYHYSGKKAAILFSVAGFFLSVILMLDVSKPLWKAIPFMAFLQYPWRFLLLASFFSSFLTGVVIWFLKQEFRKVKYFNTVPYLSAGVLVFLLLFFNAKLFQPQTIFSKTVQDYTNDVALRWVASKISDEYLPKDFLKPKSENEVIENKIKIKSASPKFVQTKVAKVANVVSLAGVAMLIIGIIYRRKKEHEETKR